MGERLLRIAQVLERVPLSKAQLYRRMAEGTFPRPRRLGPNSEAWVESELDAWIASLPSSGDGNGDRKEAA